VLKIQDVFSFKEIRNGFNSFFLKNSYEKLSNEIINDIILCIISLLQGVKLIDEKSKREIGNLCFAVSSKEVFLMATVEIQNKGRYVKTQFQVLTAKNSYENIKPSDKFDTPFSFNEEIIEVINAGRRLVITFTK
jgi:hypothetical protein